MVLAARHMEGYDHMAQVATPKFGIGAPVRRTEDPALITGRGCFVADVAAPGALHGYVLRSPVANGRFSIADLDAAREAPGVHLILTGEDVAQYGDLAPAAQEEQPDGSMPEHPPYPLICRGQVRHVGDAVAFIVADSVNAAKSAGELIDIDYEPLEAAVGTDTALDPATRSGQDHGG